MKEQLFLLPEIDKLKDKIIYITRHNLKPIGYCKVISYDDNSVKLEEVGTRKYFFINRRSFYFGITNDLLTSEKPMVRLSDVLKIKYYVPLKTNTQ